MRNSKGGRSPGSWRGLPLFGDSCARPEPPRRDADEALEVAGELALVREAGAGGQLRQEAVTVSWQELLGPLDAAGEDVLVRRQPGGPLELPGVVVGAEAGGLSPLLQAPAAGHRVACEQIPMLVGLAGQLQFGHARIGVVAGINDVLAVRVGATGFEPSQHRCLAAVIPAQVSSAQASFCAPRSDTPKGITAKRTDSPSPGGRAWGALGIDNEALDRVIGTGRGELEGQALTAWSLDGRSVFCLGPGT